MLSVPGLKILIISADTGGGHRAAASAIVAGAQELLAGQNHDIRVVRIEESRAVTEKFIRLYNWLLREKQHWMKYLYWIVNHLRPETKERFYARTVAYVYAMCEHWRPHVVVSVHPMIQHATACLLKKLEDRIPFVTVVTDPCYGFWKGWACDDVTRYLVASAEAQQQLIDYGISPERIKVTGMPVHPKFKFPSEAAAREARIRLGLDPLKFTVFINAGWAGGGNIPTVFRELVRGKLDIQAIFLAGRNEALLGEARAIAAVAKFPCKVIGYSDEVEQLMSAASVMISKLGGLSTFEALTCGVPILADVTTPPMPQERGAADMIVSHKAGILLQRADTIVPVISRLMEDPTCYAAMRQATGSLIVPHAAYRVVEEIVKLIPAARQTYPAPEILQGASV
jgi:UDP-N-acetylglucosamine:LPS N-acetylglucosamine transferase